MRILYASSDVVPAPKGAAVHIEAFVRALARRHEVTLVSLRSATAPPLDIPGVRHIALDLSEPNFLRRTDAFADAVEDLLGSDAWDAAQFRSIWEGVPLCLARRRTGLRLVYELNGLPSIELPFHYPALEARGSLIRRFQQDERFCMDSADYIITPSQVTAQYLYDIGVASDKVRVIPNGVDPSLFSPGPAEQVRAGEILYVGTLAPWQGLETLLRAVRKLLGRTGPGAGEPEPAEAPAPSLPAFDVRLTVCGHGRKESVKQCLRLAMKMRIADRVEWTGPLPQQAVVSRIQRAAVCVAPLSPDERNLRQGCCPIKLLEYAACRKPIVASDLQVVTDLFTPEAEIAVYRPRSAQHLAERIAEVLQHPDWAAGLANAAFEKVGRRFTWDIAGRSLLRVYDEMPSEMSRA